MRKDPYSILNLPRHATRREVTAAYRRLAREHHPDVSEGQDSISRMQEINWAYEVLRDPKKRSSYNEASAARGRTGRNNGASRDWSWTPAPSGAYSAATSSIGVLGDRAIIGFLAALGAFAVSLIFGLDFTWIGSLIAITIGVWIASDPNTRVSSQNGAAIGGVIGLFAAAVIGIYFFDVQYAKSPLSGLVCCAPSIILLGASLGAMLGGFAAQLRKLQA